MKMIIAKFKRIRGGHFLFTRTPVRPILADNKNPTKRQQKQNTKYGSSLFCFLGTNLIAAILAEQESGEMSLS